MANPTANPTATPAHRLARLLARAHLPGRPRSLADYDLSTKYGPHLLGIGTTVATIPGMITNIVSGEILDTIGRDPGATGGARHTSMLSLDHATRISQRRPSTSSAVATAGVGAPVPPRYEADCGLERCRHACHTPPRETGG